MTGRVALAASALAIVSSSAVAQTVSGALDVGTARITYADSIAATSASISPAFRVAGIRSAISGVGTVSQLRGTFSSSGRLDGSFTPFARGAVSAELTGLAGGSSHGNGTRTGQVMGSARLHAGRLTRGAWIGGGVGRTWDGSWRDVAQGEIGAWLAANRSSLVATVTPVVVDDSIRYTDSFLSLQREAGAWDVDGSLGFRAGQQLPRLPANSDLWGSLAVTLWATPRVGVVAAGGSYPVDFTQGYPGGRYVSLSVRLRAPATVRAPASPSPAAAGITGFSVQRTSGDAHLIRVRAPLASSVDILGDFTQWSPVALRAAGDGWWTASLPIARGSHELTVRIDKRDWLVPPGTILRRDEFGGSVGVLIVR